MTEMRSHFLPARRRSLKVQADNRETPTIRPRRFVPMPADRRTGCIFGDESLLQLIRRDVREGGGKGSYRQEQLHDVFGPPHLLGVEVVFPAIGNYPRLPSKPWKSNGFSGSWASSRSRSDWTASETTAGW